MSSSTQLLQTLPYFPDSAPLFTTIADQPWAIFLDSGYPHSQQGRYDILAAEPVCTLVTHGQNTTITKNGTVTVSESDPFLLLKQELAATPLPGLIDLPFNGGALGYFSYDLARCLEKLPNLAKDEEQIPEMAVGIYEWAVIVDHEQQQSCLVALNTISEQLWQSLIALFSSNVRTGSPLEDCQSYAAFEVLTEPQSNMTQQDYARAFDRIKYYLQEGDCYQVNLTQRFESSCRGNPWSAYQALRKINAAPFSAYLNFPEVQVLSSSPERFLKLRDGIVETKPIKGTRPRKSDAIENQRQIQNLINSDKDRAENVMIVDLLRNDIGKSCEDGSVRVPKLFEIETYTTVHHLVSTVTGVLAKNQHALDLLRRCFPGGSITGAPKIRAMEIIEELEPHRRGIYCGSIGYIGFDGNMDTNIAIRTLVHSGGMVRFWAGGGIVHDSVMQEEYQESFDKAAALLQLLAEFTNEQ
jgi:para-aminobenzoate synthetase component 1